MKLRSAAIKLYSCVFGRTTGLISDRTYTRTLYYLSFGCLPNLEQPKKFSEHICAIKLSDDTLAYRKYADKYEVRRFVARELGESYLIPMLGVYKSFDEIPFPDFPKRFVLKATHASGYNVIVRDKDQLNLSAVRRKFRKWLKKDYYLVGRENNYKNIRPRILAEPFLDFGSTLREYKIFCFHGQVRMICVHCFDEKGRTVTAFDPDWYRLDVTMGYPAAASMPKPKELTDF
ncbi:MAG: ATP-grasp fold amidoligase family protein [Faecousia sp.]